MKGIRDKIVSTNIGPQKTKIFSILVSQHFNIKLSVYFSHVREIVDATKFNPLQYLNLSENKRNCKTTIDIISQLPSHELLANITRGNLIWA